MPIQTTSAVTVPVNSVRAYRFMPKWKSGLEMFGPSLDPFCFWSLSGGRHKPRDAHPSTHLTVLHSIGSPPKWRGRKRGTSSLKRLLVLFNSRNSHVQLRYPRFSRRYTKINNNHNNNKKRAHSEAAPWRAFTQRALLCLFISSQTSV